MLEGVPHFVSVAEEGIALYAVEGLQLESPRHLPAPERHTRGLAEYARWHQRAGEFLAGVGFYRERGSMAMAALMLHQACEHFYQCVLWSLTLHGPRIHALDELRENAEALDERLRAAWPRENPFGRRAFGCVRRAYVEARFGRKYRISDEELAWAMARAATLHDLTEQLYAERLAACSELRPDIGRAEASRLSARP